MMRLVAMLVLGVTLSGCGIAHMESRGIAYASDRTAWKNGTVRESKAQRLFVWKSDYSAGIGTEEGICVQGALTAVAKGTEASAKLGPAALLAVNPALSAKATEDLVTIGAKQSQSVMLTNTTNGQTAFANIALFYLCQISLNRSLDPATIASMWAETHRTLALIKPENAGVSGTSSKAPGSATQPVDATNGSSAPQTPPAGSSNQ